MLNDEELPFVRIMAQFNISNSGSAQVFRYFRVATRAARKGFDDDLSADKCKAQAEAHEAVAATVAASKLVADKSSMIEIRSTPKDSKMNPTYNTDRPQSFQTPNALENSSTKLK